MKRKLSEIEPEQDSEPPVKKHKPNPENIGDQQPEHTETEQIEKEKECEEKGKEQEIDDKILDLVKSHSFKNEDKKELSIESISFLSESRSIIYSEKYNEIKSSFCILSVVLNENENGSKIERIAMIDKDEKNEYILKEKMVECSIGALCEKDEFAPSEFIEFCFDGNDQFYLSPLCVPCLNYYKSQQFALWKQMLIKPDCEGIVFMTFLFLDYFQYHRLSDISSINIKWSNNQSIRSCNISKP